MQEDSGHDVNDQPSLEMRESNGLNSHGPRSDNDTSNRLTALQQEKDATVGTAYGGIFSDLDEEYVSTSRGLIPRRVLLPPPLCATTPLGKRITYRREILPTDEGSRIGVVYLPKVIDQNSQLSFRNSFRMDLEIYLKYFTNAGQKNELSFH